MKRGSGPKRKTRLKADPEKTRAFEQRGREAGREGMKSAALRSATGWSAMDTAAPRKPYDRAKREVDKALERLARPTVEKQQRRGVALDPVRLTHAEALRVEFRAVRPARAQRCFQCGAQASSWHHWLPQQAIRMAMRPRRELLPREVKARVRKLLRDERNLSSVCAGCHDEHERWARRFVSGDVPSTAHEFAAELGAEWSARLVRLYPAAGFAANETGGRTDGRR